jgi:heterodisulfide reductase subunit A-like polyferredoxin
LGDQATQPNLELWRAPLFRKKSSVRQTCVHKPTILVVLCTQVAARAGRVQVSFGTKLALAGARENFHKRAARSTDSNLEGREDVSIEVDVAVVGGGPAGAAAAQYLATRGHSVIVCEKKTFPREKT